MCAVSVLIKRFVQLFEISLGLLFVAEDLNNALTCHYLLHKALSLTHCLLLTDKILCRAAADGARYLHHNKHAAYNKQGKPQRIVEHYREYDKHNSTCLDKCGDRLRNELAQSVYIIGVMAHYIAVAVGIEVLYRQILHLLEHRAAHLGKEALRDIRHHLRVSNSRCNAEHVQRDKQNNNRDKLRPCGCPVTAFDPFFDYLDNFLRKQRGYCGNSRRE